MEKEGEEGQEASPTPVASATITASPVPQETPSQSVADSNSQSETTELTNLSVNDFYHYHLLLPLQVINVIREGIQPYQQTSIDYSLYNNPRYHKINHSKLC